MLVRGGVEIATKFRATGVLMVTAKTGIIGIYEAEWRSGWEMGLGRRLRRRLA
jgi:hypothetical protein